MLKKLSPTVRAWLPTVLVALVSMAGVFIVAQNNLDYELYSPGPQVRRWHSDFNLDLSNLDFDSLKGYAQDVGVKRVAPVIIVGVLCFIGLLIWTCCRCCGKCRLTDASTCCKTVLMLLLLGTLIAGIAMISVGFDADRQQSDAMEAVPGVVDNVVQFLQDTSDYVVELGAVADDLAANTVALLEADNGTGVITQSTVQDLNDAVDLIETLADSIDTEVSDIDLTQLEDFSDNVDKYNEQRHLGLVIVLAVLLSLVLLEGLFALLNAYAGDDYKPKKNCMRYFTPVIGILAMIVLLVLWILSGALVGIMTASSDVCYDPNTQFTNLLEDTSNSQDVNDLISFFINCGQDPTLPNPLQSDINGILSSLNDSQVYVLDLRQEVRDEPNCDTPQYNSTCEAIAAALANTTRILDDLEEVLGANTIDSTGNARDGFLSLAGCYGLNERYNLVLRTFCGDAVEALGKSTEVVLGFAVIYVFTQADTGLDEDDDTSKVL
ncbi:hypothetical protein PTSG_09167 [Salpingoeca rosetta]|uniref:Uncharacterized protein n=1 Tax=Salpingoeca rosetta (strain ATCC 50818 / BSB-021) TaxID=946362 RepID=F2UMX3_SALR5|nr:uncharacterized protein PTSG_09167 [Salpingoeca rosetta]EGD78472.1 hypothetical protein PTSG_09167 [Salpingoeca rosetta]|eukprot:XP_004989421.1 hypothetical protein PTSG_09167 [Salpingoeca rosetta]